MPIYNNQAFGQAAETIASMFAPPSASDVSAYSTAALNRQKKQQLEELFGAGKTPSERASLIGVQNYGQTPQGFTYQVDQNTATTRRGQDIDAATSRANNRETAQFNLAGKRYGTPVGQGEILPPVPTTVAEFFGIPEMPGVQGQAKPLSETEWDAAQKERLQTQGTLTDQQLLDAIIGERAPVEAVGPDGKSRYMAPGEAARTGAEVAARTPLVNIGPNGEPLGSPGDGLVWQRDAGGNIVYDDRGAPIAIPYQGGKAFEEQRLREEAGAAADQRSATKSGIVLQNVDRALEAIRANPRFTTGVGAQATSWLDGTPARALKALLDPIRANIGFDQLQAMREASPTGGALGNVTERELTYLQDVLGSIDPAAGPQVIDDIKRLKNVYLDIVHGPNQGPPREKLSFPTEWDAYSGDGAGGDTGNGFAEGAIATNPATGERIILRDGQWEPLS